MLSGRRSVVATEIKARKGEAVNKYLRPTAEEFVPEPKLALMIKIIVKLWPKEWDRRRSFKMFTTFLSPIHELANKPMFL